MTQPFVIDLEPLAFQLQTFLKVDLSRIPQKNNLRQSHLWQSIDYDFDNDKGIIEITANFYILFVDTGRKPHVNKVPISALLKWIAYYKINAKKLITDLQLAFAIQTAIYQNGINPRPFLAQYIARSVEYAQKYVGEQFAIQVLDALIPKQNVKS